MSDLRASTLPVFTFRVGEGCYAVDLGLVLSIEERAEAIRPMPVRRPEVLGVATCRGAWVPVFDLATALSVESVQTSVRDLVATLEAREQDHVDWLDALARAVGQGEPFNKALDPTRCAFGRWYADFRTRDEALREILARFDEPHRRIHALGERLLALRDGGRVEEALAVLQHERMTTLVYLRKLFEQARDQLRTHMRPVLLFLGRPDGTPAVALQIDAPESVADFPPDAVHPIDVIGLSEDPGRPGLVRGMLRADGHDAVWLDPLAMLGRAA